MVCYFKDSTCLLYTSTIFIHTVYTVIGQTDVVSLTSLVCFESITVETVDTIPGGKPKVVFVDVYKRQGYNLHCFTKYSGADPEVDTRRSTPMTPGVDYSAYPKSRSFVGGINVTF